MALARELASLATSEPQLLAARKALIGALAAQLVLGLLAFLSVYVVVGRNPGNVGQSLFPTLHVMGGAALLLACVASFMWSLRLSRAPEPRVVHAIEHAPALVEIEATR
jgi:uncharacterized membrane protein YkvI